MISLEIAVNIKVVRNSSFGRIEQFRRGVSRMSKQGVMSYIIKNE